MLGLTANLSSDLGTTWVPLAVLTASVMGSAHCVGMCGGLVTSVCRTRLQWAGYQLGRLLSYVFLGAGVGALGHHFLAEGALKWAAWVSAGLMALAFFALGAKAWKGGSPHFSVVPQSVLSWFYRRAHGAPFWLGALSAALPCGWLQSFVLASAATQSAARGGVLMAVFWLGTLPALSAVPWITHHLLRPASVRAPKITAMLLIVAGLAGIGFKMSSLWAQGGKAHCHCEVERGKK